MKRLVAAAQTEDNLFPVVKLKRVHPTSCGVDTPQQGHQYVTGEEKRTATAALELLQETEDPTATDGTQTLLGEAAHFEGTGLMDNIRSSLKKKKGTHSHLTMQQATVLQPVPSQLFPSSMSHWPRLLLKISSTSSQDWVHPTSW